MSTPVVSTCNAELLACFSVVWTDYEERNFTGFKSTTAFAEYVYNAIVPADDVGSWMGFLQLSMVRRLFDGIYEMVRRGERARISPGYWICFEYRPTPGRVVSWQASEALYLDMSRVLRACRLHYVEELKVGKRVNFLQILQTGPATRGNLKRIRFMAAFGLQAFFRWAAPRARWMKMVGKTRAVRMMAIRAHANPGVRQVFKRLEVGNYEGGGALADLFSSGLKNGDVARCVAEFVGYAW